MIGNGSSTALITPDAKICWMSHPLPDSGSLFAHHPWRRRRRPLLRGTGQGLAGPGPALRGQHHDRGNPLGGRHRDGLPGAGAGRHHQPGPGAVRHRRGADRVRAAAGLRQRAVQHGGARRRNCTWWAPSDPIILLAPGVSFSITSDGRHATATADVNLQDGPVVLNLRCGDTEPQPAAPATDETGAPRRRRPSFPALGPGPGTAGREAVAGPPLRAGAARPGARAHRRRAGRAHHLTAGGNRRHPELGLPVLLAAGRLHDRQRPRGPGLHRRGRGFLAWLGRILAHAPGPEWLHPLYSVTGAPLSTEAIIESLPGYAGSRPVRIGNAADHQVQLDVFGPIAELIDALSDRQGVLWPTTTGS